MSDEQLVDWAKIVYIPSPYTGSFEPYAVAMLECGRQNEHNEGKGFTSLNTIVTSAIMQYRKEVLNAIAATPKHESSDEQPDELPWYLHSLFHEKINSICEEETHALDCADKIVALIEDQWPTKQESSDATPLHEAVKVMREALEFYGNTENHLPQPAFIAPVSGRYMSIVEVNDSAGKRAREALARVDELLGEKA